MVKVPETFTFEFVNRDVRAQRDCAAEVLEAARALSYIGETEGSVLVRHQICATVANLLTTATRLTANADRTSKDATKVVSHMTVLL
jgi:hypothetical protein